MPCLRRLSTALFLCLCALPAPCLHAADTVAAKPRADGEPKRRIYTATRLAGPAPAIDGRLDDAAWQTQGEWADDFIQREPHEGAKATYPTELKVLFDVGLGYIRLGQAATTLSGGEAQRIKLSRELSKRDTGKTFYILDEPTTGLHFVDIEKLLHVLNELVERGNTVVVIEHNLDVIKNADYIIDLGPEGGSGGGTIIATGTPEEIAKNESSYTGQYLKKYLK